MLTILYMYRTLVGSERIYSETVRNEAQESSYNMSTVVNTPAIHKAGVLVSEDVGSGRGQEPSPPLTEDNGSLLDKERGDINDETIIKNQDAESWLLDHDSESTSYHDARSSLSQEEEADLMSSQEEEIEEESNIYHEEGSESGPKADLISEGETVVATQKVSLNVEDSWDMNQKSGLTSSETNGNGCDSTNDNQTLLLPISLLHSEDDQCITKDDVYCQSSYERNNNHTTAKEEPSHDNASRNNQRKQDVIVAPGPPVPNECSSSRGRLSPNGKALSPCQYQSDTLGRRNRKARHVPGPTTPDKHGRGNRSQTEPPPELAPPDILQISWVWETRSPTRTASIRRRPSRRVSCRRKPRPRLAPRKSSSSRGNTPIQSYVGDVKLPEDEATIVFPPDVLRCNPRGNSPPKRFLPCCDNDAVPFDDSLPRENAQVRLRNKRTSNYFQSASRALKQKWRNSEIPFPSFFNETLENMKNKDDDHIKNEDIFEKTKAFPLPMRKFSYLLKLLKGNRRMANVDLYVDNSDSSSRVFMEMKAGLVSRLGKRRKSIHRSNGVGMKRQSSFSPRNSFMGNSAISWSQKYQNVMGSRVKSDGVGVGGGCGPTIQVTEANSDDVFTCEESDIVSTTETRLMSHLQQPQLEQQQRKKGVLNKIMSRIRPSSLANSRSFASSRSSMSGGSEDGHSPSHSSDYEDQDDTERSGSASLVGRMRGLRRDMQKKISRLKSPRGSTSSSPGPLNSTDKSGSGLPLPSHQQPAASSYESLPASAPVASTTALGSNRSSLSGEEAEPYTGPFISRARALVDCQPSPYDRDALKFKKGDIIDIISKNPSGLWKGCIDGRVGHFKFILVEEEVERPARRPWRGTTPRRGRACTLEELLTRLHLGHLIQVFVLNGYEDLEQFRDVEKADLDCLGITDPETCAKILTAVALLHDADSEPEDLPETLDTTEAALRRGDHGRDSGCYTDHRSTTAVALDENNLDTRQSTPSTDTSSGYHSRGAYNIPLGEATLTSRDDQSSALDSPSSESATAGVTAPSTTHSEPHSYRAHLATVLPASPRAKLRHNQQGDMKQKQDPQVDYEAKYVTARSVFEKDLVKREVPFTVRSPKRSAGSSPTEMENGLKNDSSVSVEDEASP